MLLRGLRLPLSSHERFNLIPTAVYLRLAHRLYPFAGQWLLLCEDRPLRAVATTSAEFVFQQLRHVLGDAGELPPDASEVGISVLAGFDLAEIHVAQDALYAPFFRNPVAGQFVYDGPAGFGAVVLLADLGDLFVFALKLGLEVGAT